jgi:hypothetical protein
MTAIGSDGGFADEVRARFSYLENKGFVATEASPNEVRYESNKVNLVVAHSERDGEVSISFGRRDRPEKFSFTLFLRLVNPTLERLLGERMPQERSQLRKCLDDLAGALDREGTQILAGDDLVFERMKHVRWWDFQPQAIK